ncbi:MAG: acyl carrier protein [Saprospiraceae bacterium]|nr:acyl carrier protein [Saprospiraceae bacterium]
MQEQEIIEKLTEVIKTYVEDKSVLEGITPETHLVNDLNINSAHLVDIILDTEEAFDIEIDDESAEQMLTVKAAVDIVSSKLSS